MFILLQMEPYQINLYNMSSLESENHMPHRFVLSPTQEFTQPFSLNRDDTVKGEPIVVIVVIDGSWEEQLPKYLS